MRIDILRVFVYHNPLFIDSKFNGFFNQLFLYKIAKGYISPNESTMINKIIFLGLNNKQFLICSIKK